MFVTMLWQGPTCASHSKEAIKEVRLGLVFLGQNFGLNYYSLNPTNLLGGGGGTSSTLSCTHLHWVPWSSFRIICLKLDLNLDLTQAARGTTTGNFVMGLFKGPVSLSLLAFLSSLPPPSHIRCARCGLSPATASLPLRRPPLICMLFLRCVVSTSGLHHQLAT